ncbi:MAG: L,D-transpeptidase [Rhodospirillaceae bacterium]|nr:L,D-transpeptidase [Rhodospirillaceae bacterium]
MSTVSAKLRRVFGAAKFALAALVLLAGAAHAASNVGPQPGKVTIEVDKRTQRMTVYVDGEKRHEFKVSTGAPGHVTPSGEFRPSSMHKMAISIKYGNTPMPHAIFFTRVGHAIHATTAVSRLGHPASHGCIRLSPEDAKTLYDLVGSVGLGSVTIKIV